MYWRPTQEFLRKIGFLNVILMIGVGHVVSAWSLQLVSVYKFQIEISRILMVRFSQKSEDKCVNLEWSRYLPAVFQIFPTKVTMVNSTFVKMASSSSRQHRHTKAYFSQFYGSFKRIFRRFKSFLSVFIDFTSVLVLTHIIWRIYSALVY